MSRINNIFLWAFFFGIGLMSLSCEKEEKPLRFAVVSDFHAADVPAGRERMETFIHEVTEEQVDFIIELGDFCRLDSASQFCREAWNSFVGDKYHVIGNHDLDNYTVEQYVRGMGLPNRYYSFDKSGFHFVVLDGNNFFDGKQLLHYENANYMAYDYKSRSYLDPEQLEWLVKDLAATDLKVILFSHQSIDLELKNGAEVRSILEAENKRVGFKKVVLAFSGHDHSNYTKEINGITYMQINSASYVWIGEPTQTEKRFSQEINERYPLMKYSVMYDRPLYAIVSLDEDGAEVKGVKAAFIPPHPKAIGLKDSINGLPLVSTIEDCYVKFFD